MMNLKENEREAVMQLFVGVEGGASSTVVGVYDADANLLGHATGGPSNQFTIGFEKTAKEICDTLSKALETVKGSFRIKAMGLCMSGLMDKKNQEVLSSCLKCTTNLKDSAIHCWDDTYGSISTASSSGYGSIIIAGTGSAGRAVWNGGSLLVGGRGHIIGDFGSGYDLALHAIQNIYLAVDGLHPTLTPEDVSVAMSLLMNHFKLETLNDMYPIVYRNFDKSHVATFCKKLAENYSSPFIMSVFERTGVELARLVAATTKQMKNEEGNEEVVCVGSVWKSFSLFSSSFLNELETLTSANLKIRFLDTDSTFGAARLASSCIGERLPFKPPTLTTLR